MENSNETPKKRLSAFEYAILQTADPEEAKNYEPASKKDETKERIESFMNKAKDFRIKYKNH